MSDRSYMAAVYDRPAHYWEDGAWKDADNSLREAADEEDATARVLENKKNGFQTKFAKKANQNKLAALQQGEYRVKWSLEGAKKAEARVIGADGGQEGTDKSALKNIAGTVVYEDIVRETDLRYTVDAQSVKEDIVLKSKNVPSRYIFDFELKKLRYERQEI